MVAHRPEEDQYADWGIYKKDNLEVYLSCEDPECECLEEARVAWVTGGLERYARLFAAAPDMMALIAEMYRPKAVILPIGGKYTMGPREAAKAVQLIQAEVAIPCHYDTFPNQRVDIEQFRRLVSEQAPKTRLEVVRPGEAVTIR